MTVRPLLLVLAAAATSGAGAQTTDAVNAQLAEALRTIRSCRTG